MTNRAMRTVSLIILATTILIGAALVRGITWSISHDDRFTSTETDQALPQR
jgi:hypothetical protein